MFCGRPSGEERWFWKEKSSVSLISYSKNHINVTVREYVIRAWRFTGFYGFPESTRRRGVVGFSEIVKVQIHTTLVCDGRL